MIWHVVSLLGFIGILVVFAIGLFILSEQYLPSCCTACEDELRGVEDGIKQEARRRKPLRTSVLGLSSQFSVLGSQFSAACGS